MSVCNGVIKFCLGLNGTENGSKFRLQSKTLFREDLCAERDTALYIIRQNQISQRSL